jgi:hypothetical protein
VVVVLVLPFAVVAVVALAAVVVVQRSSLAITAVGVEIRNYPQAPRLIPLAQIDRFEATPRVGNFAFLRPATAVLVLVGGARVPVRSISAAGAGRGVEALNRRVEALRGLG